MDIEKMIQEKIQKYCQYCQHNRCYIMNYSVMYNIFKQQVLKEIFEDSPQKTENKTRETSV